MAPGAMAIGAAERDAVLATLEPDYIAAVVDGRLPEAETAVGRFETAFADAVGTRYAVSANSGTSALFASLLACGVGPGDEVIVPAYSFIACAAAVVTTGALPVITDIDRTMGLDPVAVRANLTGATKAIIVAHMRGVPADLTALEAVARTAGCALIEDAAQACGAHYADRRVGGWGTTGAFSFHPTKTITSDQGGVVVTNDADLYRRLRSATDAEWLEGGGERCESRPFTGLNLKMSHMAAALAHTQLSRLTPLVDAMRERHALVEGAIVAGGRYPIRVTPEGATGTGCAVVFYAPTPDESLAIRGRLRSVGITAHVLYVEGEHNWRVSNCWHDIVERRDPRVTRAAADAGSAGGPAPGQATLDLLRTAVHIDINPHMTMDEAEQLAATVAQVLGERTPTL